MKPITIILRGMPQVDRATEILRMLPLEPVMEVTIRQHKDSKSLAQLRTVHMWIKEIQEAFQESHGKFYTVDSLKEWLKGLFGIIDILETPKEKVEVVRSFADYSQEEMSKFMETMSHYCGSELRIFLTLPDDQGREQ